MEREYIAFISYRHKPLDMAVAKRVHRLVERYTVPKEYRRNRQKRMGLVFRDQEELPLSSDLSSSIYTALVHSQYLIVICTPDLPASKWCMEEINTFIAMHGQERVLTVLASGTPEESFPPQLLHRYDAKGNVIQDVEPLAANIASDTMAGTLRKLRGETLRLLAAMLGCPYDALRQRQKRYRQRRAIIALSGGLAITASFAGMLIHKNAQVQVQYEQAQRNLRAAQLSESQALTETARQQWRAGLRIDAIKSLVDALPSPDALGEQPYAKEAETLLVNAMNTYSDRDLRFVSNLSQNTEVRRLCVSGDGASLATLDNYGSVRYFDVASGIERWQVQPAGMIADKTALDLQWCEAEKAVLCLENDHLALLSAVEGRTLWKLVLSGAARRAERKETVLRGGAFARVAMDSFGENIVLFTSLREDGAAIYWLDPSNGKVRHALSCLEMMDDLVLSTAVMSPDGRYAACAVTSLLGKHGLLVADRDRETCWLSVTEDPESWYMRPSIAFTTDGRLAVVWTRGDVEGDRPAHISLLAPAMGGEQWSETLELQMTEHIPTEAWEDVLCTEDYLIYHHTRDLYALDVANGSLLHHAVFPGEIVTACQTGSGEDYAALLCVLRNGIVSYMIVSKDEMTILYDWDRYYHMDFIVANAAAICREGQVSLAVVPYNRENEAVVLKFNGGQPLYQLDKAQAISGNVAMSSSAERLMLCGDEGYDIVDGENGSLLLHGEWGDMPAPRINRVSCPVFTLDGTKAIVDNWIVDLASNESEPLRLPNDETAACASNCWVDSMEGAVSVAPMLVADDATTGFSADAICLYKNGQYLATVPIPSGKWTRYYGAGQVEANGILENRLVVGGSGLVALTQEDAPGRKSVGRVATYDIAAEAWHVFEIPSDHAGEVALAVGNERKLIAVLTPDQVLRLYDADGEAYLLERPMDVPFALVQDIFFAPDDSLLAVLLKDDRLLLISAEDGSTLQVLDLDGSAVNASAAAGIGMQLDGDARRLYVYVPTGANGCLGACVDMDDGTVLQEIQGLCGVDVSRNKLYKYDATKKAIAVYPCYTLPQIIEKGRQMIYDAP